MILLSGAAVGWEVVIWFDVRAGMGVEVLGRGPLRLPLANIPKETNAMTAAVPTRIFWLMVPGNFGLLYHGWLPWSAPAYTARLS